MFLKHFRRQVSLAGPRGGVREPREAMPCQGLVPYHSSVLPAIFHGMRKTLSPDPGSPSPRERTDGLLVKAWDWESGALDAFPGYIRNLLCGTTYFCAHVSSSSFPLARRFFQTFHLAARMFFFPFRRVFFAALPARCCQYLDQTPTPAQASPRSWLFPSISSFPLQSCYCLAAPACGQNFSLCCWRQHYWFCHRRCTRRLERLGCRGQSQHRAQSTAGRV